MGPAKGIPLIGTMRWHPKVNIRHMPGAYMGKCHVCQLYIEADKRAYLCDDCWDLQQATIKSRRDADEREDIGH
jgi:Zn finger protein HypA/HybF involved in hydrogenase expression